MDAKQMKSLTLAYIGDAVYELYVRNYLINEGYIQPQKLHEQAVTFVSGKAQAQTINHFLESDVLTENEASVFRRGRNSNSGSVPRNVPVQTYRYSTGFEALLGYLYIDQQEERLHELLQLAVHYITERNVNNG